MNIFYIDTDIKTCAQSHVDKHCVKMLIEYPQLLSTAHHVLDGNIVTVNGRKSYRLTDSIGTNIYKSTHVNHPSAIWTRQSAHNYMWLYNLWTELLDEYTFRYGKIHASTRLKDYLKNPPRSISDWQFTQPTPAMPDEYKVVGNSLQSYRNYYANGKKHLHAWKNRSVPEWIITK